MKNKNKDYFIRVHKDVHDLIASKGTFGESFSDVLKRLLIDSKLNNIEAVSPNNSQAKVDKADDYNRDGDSRLKSIVESGESGESGDSGDSSGIHREGK
jgi:predicted CopG family antitoxin